MHLIFFLFQKKLLMSYVQIIENVHVFYGALFN